MTDRTVDHLQILGQLAREYEQKYKELEAFAESADPETLPRQLRLRGEMTTDRFRAAQLYLLRETAIWESQEGEDACRALTALFRCFDEMRLLFQYVLEHAPKSDEQRAT